MFCPACGVQITDIARFCRACGKSLPTPPPQTFAANDPYKTRVGHALVEPTSSDDLFATQVAEMRTADVQREPEATKGKADPFATQVGGVDIKQLKDKLPPPQPDPMATVVGGMPSVKPSSPPSDPMATVVGGMPSVKPSSP
ncbi:MAG: zinc ribbon domain-containing protein, partial [Acidobacteriota bacterium]|nr:zinc ribbon domain-containing protein [Acidobacteriota bacterium]